MKEKEIKIGLALGSGGLRGLAHIGVIKALIKNNISIDYISGASVGALVGAYFATYGEIDSLEDMIIKRRKEILPLFFDLGKKGIVSGNKINNFVKKTLNDIEFSDTKIPFYVIATNLKNGKKTIFHSGKIATAVRSSISIPLVFAPFGGKGELFVDGGLSDPVPVDILKEKGADKVIAVNLYHENELNRQKISWSDMAMQSVRIALVNLSKESIKNANIVINPDTSKYVIKRNMFKKLKEENIRKIILLGEKETIRHLSEIKKLTK
jgi:NTE family protein